MEAMEARARDILKSLNVLESDIDEQMIDTTIGFLTAYDVLDSDKNGRLSTQEFIQAAKKLNPNHDPQKFMMLCDLNADGIVTQAEFVRAFVIVHISDRYCGIFQEFDTNGDGKIDKAELAEGLTKRGYDPNKIEQVFTDTDEDGTGYISYYEFSLAVLKGTIKLN